MQAVSAAVSPVSSRDAFVDFGDDALTEGRAHPMIDPTLRLERLARELEDPDVAVVVLDVVLGFGSHPDPAGGLAAVLGRAPADRPHVVVSLCGTRADPQGLDAQAARLREASATVAPSAAGAARLALLAAGRTPP
jgi:FdrA protein